MKDSLEVRAADERDAPALADIISALGFPADADTIMARLHGLRSLGEQVLVAVRAGATIGFVTVHVTPVLHRPTFVGRITALAVAAPERGTGAGRALVAAAEQHVRARGCALIELTSNFDLTPAHAFYQHLGYVKTSYRFFKRFD